MAEETFCRSAVRGWRTTWPGMKPAFLFYREKPTNNALARTQSD